MNKRVENPSPEEQALREQIFDGMRKMSVEQLNVIYRNRQRYPDIQGVFKLTKDGRKTFEGTIMTFEQSLTNFI